MTCQRGPRRLHIVSATSITQNSSHDWAGLGKLLSPRPARNSTLQNLDDSSPIAVSPVTLPLSPRVESAGCQYACRSCSFAGNRAMKIRASLFPVLMNPTTGNNHMNAINRTLPIAAVLFFLPSSLVLCDEPGDQAKARAGESRFKLVEAEFEVRMHELESEMSQRVIEEAKIEMEKSRLNLTFAQEKGDAREIEFAKLQLKQSEIRVETHKMKSEMAHLGFKRARARMEYLRSALTATPEKRARVELEYVEDSEVVIVRGPKKSVDKIRALIENAAR